MKSVYYTFTTWGDGERAAGFDGSHQAAIVRQPARKGRAPGGDNVIDLAAWRAANRELWEERAGPAPERAGEEAGPAPRARRSHRRVYIDPELAAIVAVVGVLTALMIRVLIF